MLGDRDVNGVVAFEQPLGVDDREPNDLANDLAVASILAGLCG
jgi:hypothetical protein